MGVDEGVDLEVGVVVRVVRVVDVMGSVLSVVLGVVRVVGVRVVVTGDDDGDEDITTTLAMGVVPLGQVAGGRAYLSGSQHMAPGGAQGRSTSGSC